MALLRLLTWNVFLLPSLARQSPKNDARAAAIADALLEADVDVICLTKAFDNSARRLIEHRLLATHPYQVGPVNAGRSPFSIHGGVIVLSRLPLRDYQEIRFHETAGVESFARKGALFVRGTIEGQGFQVIATHLKGDDGPVFDERFQAIRDHQMVQIEEELCRSCVDASMPLFVCGDLGTPRCSEEDRSKETGCYAGMLATFGAENGAERRITLDDDLSENDLAVDNTGRRAELDYILLRRGEAKVHARWERLVLQRSGWDGEAGRRDLSYRYAVKVTAEIGG
ncbi:MAG: endonuclease/exonuclease/phosphatase family protein [Byssovorax sp.]